MDVKVLLRPLSSNMITEAGVTVSEQDQVQNFNYDNDEYCPVSVDSDYGRNAAVRAAIATFTKTGHPLRIIQLLDTLSVYF